MSDTLIDIYSWPIPETVFKKEEQKIEDNPTYGFLSNERVKFLKESLLMKLERRYVTIQELTKFKENLPQDENRDKISNDILDRNLAEKLFITDFIEKGYILPERPSQDLYFRFDLKTGDTAHLDKENGPRIDLLIWWAHYFERQREVLKEQWVNMWYIKISIKKNPPDNELSIESIRIVKEKDS